MPENNNTYYETFNENYNPRSDGPTYIRAFYVYFSEFPTIRDGVAEACMRAEYNKLVYNLDYDKLSRFSMVIANDLLTYPIQILGYAENAMIQFCNDFSLRDEPINTVIFRIYNIDEHRNILIKEADLDYMREIVSVDGYVSRVGQRQVQYDVAVFECQRCASVISIQQISGKLIGPLECENEQCGRNGPFKVKDELSTFKKSQRIQITELPTNTTGNETAATLPVELDHELTGIVTAGCNIHLNAVVSTEPIFNKAVASTKLDYLLIGQNLLVAGSEIDDIEVTEDDRRRMIELSNNDNLIELLIHSFAKHIVLVDDIKLGLLCAIVSGPNTVDERGRKSRNYTHVLLCGDPATGKSELLEAIKELIPRAQYGAGDGSSMVGLTAAVVKDNEFSKGWIVEPGLLPLADLSVALIDEGDKLDPEIINRINSALSKSEMIIRKAGISAQLPCRCPVIWASNPKSGRFDTFSPIINQIHIPPDTISRFDLIYTLCDFVDEKRDEIMAQAMSGNNTCGYDLMSIDDLKKYIYLARSINDPIISDEIKLKLKSYYMNLRALGGSSDTITVTKRHHEAIERITKSVAKLHLKDVAAIDHVNIAISILNESLRQSGFDMNTGKLDSDIVALGRSTSQKDMMNKIKHLIMNLQNLPSGATVPVILEHAAELGYNDKSQVILYINKLQEDLSIFKIGGDRYRVV